MATTGTGFDVPIELNLERRQRQAADAHQEHEQKITDLINQRQQVAAKIPSLQQGTPEYDEAHKTLQGINLDLADAYHPQKNPGAIQKLGHLLTDHVGLTNPQDRQAKLDAQTQAKTAAAGVATDRAIAAAPLTATQLAMQKMQAQLDLIKKNPDTSDEDKADATRKVFGINTLKPNWAQFRKTDGTVQSFDLNRPDTIPEGASELPKGSQTAAKENIAEYEEAKKRGYKGGSFLQWSAEQRRMGAPSTSQNNLYASAYTKAYGIKLEDMTPADWDFIIRKIAYDKAIPQNTTTNTLKQNFQEQWVPIQEQNSKGPGGAAPVSPRGKPTNNTPPPSMKDLTAAAAEDAASASAAQPAAAPPAAGATPAATPPAAAPANGTSSSTPPASPKALKKEAEARNPNASGSGSANSSIKVGDPIMAAPSKEYRDAKTQYHGALVRQKQMHQYLIDAEKPGPPNQQAMLGLLFNHIGMTQGAQKGARINQKSVDEAKSSTPWIDAKIAEWFHQDQNGDYIFDGLKGGVNLTKEQMEQMVELADEGTKTLKENMETVEDTLNEGVAHPSKSSSTRAKGTTDSKKPDTSKPPKPTKAAPAGATHMKYWKGDGQWYWVDEQGNNKGKVE